MKKRDTFQGNRGSEGRREQPPSVDASDLGEGQTDWARLEAMTGEEAYRNALADPDSQPLTRDQLARMRRAPNPREIRLHLRMTQGEFARAFQIALGTLRDWEQGVHLPDSTAKAFLRVIERNPQAVWQALHPEQSEPQNWVGTIHFQHGGSSDQSTWIPHVQVSGAAQGYSAHALRSDARLSSTATAEMSLKMEEVRRAA